MISTLSFGFLDSSVSDLALDSSFVSLFFESSFNSNGGVSEPCELENVNIHIIIEKK